MWALLWSCLPFLSRTENSNVGFIWFLKFTWFELSFVIRYGRPAMIFYNAWGMITLFVVEDLISMEAVSQNCHPKSTEWIKENLPFIQEMVNRCSIEYIIRLMIDRCPSIPHYSTWWCYVMYVVECSININRYLQDLVQKLASDKPPRPADEASNSVVSAEEKTTPHFSDATHSDGEASSGDDSKSIWA